MASESLWLWSIYLCLLVLICASGATLSIINLNLSLFIHTGSSCNSDCNHTKGSRSSHHLAIISFLVTDHELSSLLDLLALLLLDLHEVAVGQGVVLPALLLVEVLQWCEDE